MARTPQMSTAGASDRARQAPSAGPDLQGAAPLSPGEEAAQKAFYVAVWGSGADKRGFLSYFDPEACEPVEEGDIDFLEVTNPLVAERRSMILMNLPPGAACDDELGRYLARICHAHLMIGLGQEFERKLRAQIGSNHGEGALFRLEGGPGQKTPSAREVEEQWSGPWGSPWEVSLDGSQTGAPESGSSLPSGLQAASASPSQASASADRGSRNSQAASAEAPPKPGSGLTPLSKAQLDPDARLPLEAQRGRKAGFLTPPVSPTGRAAVKVLRTPTNRTAALHVLRSIYQTLEEIGFLDREPEDPPPQIFSAQTGSEENKGRERKGGCC